MMAGLLIDRGVQIEPLGVAVYFNIPAILIIVLCLGLLVGAINGVLITRFNVAPFIATLGTLYVAEVSHSLVITVRRSRIWSEIPNWVIRGSRSSAPETFSGFRSSSGS